MSFLLLLSGILTILFAIYILIKWKYQLLYWDLINVPQISKHRLPIVGNMAPFVLRRKVLPDLVTDLYNEHPGRYAGLQMLGKPTLMIKDPELIKQVCIKSFEHFIDRKPFIPDDSDAIFGRILPVLTGRKWKSIRSTLSPAFTSSRLRSMFILIDETAANFTEHFAKTVDRTKPLTVELKDTFSRLTTDMIATAAFGIKCDSLANKNNDFYVNAKMGATIGPLKMLTFFGYMLVPKLMGSLKIPLLDKSVDEFFRKIVTDTMKTREREGIIRPDMIQLLMEAKKGQLKHDFTSKDADVGFATVDEVDVGKTLAGNAPKITDDDIIAQAYIFFAAGFDSVSSMLCYLFYELALNPDVQQKLQREVDEALKQNGGVFTYEMILKMKYLDMVVSETLRKWPPPVILERVCVDPFTIQPQLAGEQPVALQKHDPILIPVFAIHRDPNFYPKPDKFDPERFSDEHKHNILPGTYMPFGLGPRNCIASRLALMQLKLITAHFVSKLSVVIVEKSQVPLKLAKWNLHLGSEKGFWVGFLSRSS